MNLKEKLQQLKQERQNLQVAMIEINGAMKILEQQILETEPGSDQPSDIKALSQESEKVSSKSKA
tara:strand:- start:501 stop:695 length:195 start_codon:yes stop_codon:yes gene_type:complete